MKRALSLIMALAMILGMVPVAALAAGTGTSEDPIIITENGNYTAALTEENGGDLFYKFVAAEAGTVSVSASSENESETYMIYVNDSEIPYQDEEGTWIYTVDLEVEAEEEVVIEVFDDPGNDITFYFQFTALEGTESNPIVIISSELTEITVPADSTVYYRNSGNVNGMICTVEGNDVSVTHGEKTYAAENGKVSFSCTQASMNQHAIFAVTNHAAADATYTISFAAPVGTQDNKEVLVFGDKTATLAAGTQGYYYTWTAEKSGLFTVSMADSNTNGWAYSATVYDANLIGKGGDWNYSNPGEGEEVVPSESVTMNAGDFVVLVINTYNPEDTYNAPAGSVSFATSFVECEHTYAYTDNGDGTHKVACSGCNGIANMAQAHTYTDGVCDCGVKEGGSEEGGEESTTTGTVELAQSTKLEPAATWTAPADGYVTITVTTSAATGNSYEILANDVLTDEALSYTDFIGTITKTYPVAEGDVYTLNLWSWNFDTFANNAATIEYSFAFSTEGGSSEVVKEEYAESETALVEGENTLTMLDTAYSTVYRFTPAETGVYTFTADAAAATVGIWGYNWINGDPDAQTNTCEWTCSGLGQSVYIGVSDIQGDFTLTVAKTGEVSIGYETVIYENLYMDVAMPYIQCLNVLDSVQVGGTKTAVLGNDGYYHLNSADGPILLLDTNDADLSIGAAYSNSSMTGVVTDENGNTVKIVKYNDALAQYIVKSSTIVNAEVKYTFHPYVPLNGDLITIIQEVGKNPSRNWFNTNGWVGTDAEDAWMFMCVTAELVHTDDAGDNICDICGASTAGDVGGEEECSHEYTYSCDAHCAKCGELTNPDAAHSITAVEAVEATCTDNGNIAYWYCSICGSAWADEELTQVTNMMSVVIPGGHNLDHVAEVVPANCQEEGHSEYWYCANCEGYFGDADASWQTNPAWLTYTGDHVRPEGVAPCAVVACEICGEDTYGESCVAPEGTPVCQDSTCVNCGETIYGWGCNYNTGDEEVPLPLCQSGTCVYCGTQYEKLYECENGAWAPCQEGECSYGCGKTYPATEAHTVEDPSVGGYCQVCWSYVEPEEIVPMDAPQVEVLVHEATGAYYLTWNEDSNATIYEIYRATKKTGTYTLVDTVDGAYWEDASASVGKTYYYKVGAVNENEPGYNSQLSNPVSMTQKCVAPVVFAENNPETGRVKLSWEKVSGAKKYDVYRATSPDGKYSKLTTTSKNYYTDSKGSVGREYFYKVRAVASSSKYNSTYSFIVSGVRICAQVELSVKLDNATGKPVLSWDEVSGAASYRILRQLPGEDAFAVIAVVDDDRYTDVTAPVDTQCIYQVQAMGANEILDGAASQTVTVLVGLASPQLEGTLTATGRPSISWEAVEGAQSYMIYRSTSSSKSYKQITETTDLFFTDEEASGGKTYYYKVIALGANSESAMSSYKKLTGKCVAPVVTAENNAESGKVKLTWEKVSGAKKYYVYRATSLDGKYTKLTSTTKAYYTDSKGTRGTEYFYKVVAVASSSKYNSYDSNIVSGTRVCAQPEIKVTVDKYTGKPNVSWDKVSGATGYALHMSVNGGDYELLDVITTTTSLYMGIAEAGNTYRFAVQAVVDGNEDLNSAWSVSKEVLATCGRLSVTGTRNDAGKPQITWNADEEADYYVIYRSTKSSSGYKELDTTDDVSYTDETAKAGKTYYYKVVAVAGESESYMSSYVKIKSK